MFHMGFSRDLDDILERVNKTTTRPPQYLLFSATTPDWVKTITSKYLKTDWELIDLAKELRDRTLKKIDHLCVSCGYQNKIDTLDDLLKVHAGGNKTLVFTQSRMEATRLAQTKKFTTEVEVVHGDIP